MNDGTFKNFGKYKVIIVSAIVDNVEFNYHHNILLTNNTSFDQYYEKVKDIIATHFHKGYQMDIVNSFKIIVWNMDKIANKKIKITSTTVKNYKPGFQYSKAYNKSITQRRQSRGFHTCLTLTQYLTHFTPISNNIPNIVNLFATMDIETMEYRGSQIPVAITICLPI